MIRTHGRALLALALVGATAAGCNFFGWVGGGSGLPCTTSASCPATMSCASDGTCQPRSGSDDAGSGDAAAADAAGRDQAAGDTSGSDQQVVDAGAGDGATSDAGGRDAAPGDSSGGGDRTVVDSADGDGAAPDTGNCVDLDGDGHGASTCGGTDCDDADPDVHPGAIDFPDDGIDQDCDGFYSDAAALLDGSALFVDSTLAGAADTNPCTASQPCASLGAALAKAFAEGTREIYLAEGLYHGAEIIGGVRLHGGYQSSDPPTWSVRKPAIHVSRIEETTALGLNAAIEVTATTQVVIEGCTLVGSPTTNQAETRVGVRNIGNLWLVRDVIRGGNGVGNGVGVLSTSGSLRVSHSSVNGGIGQSSAGVRIESGGAVLDGNTIRGGAATGDSQGVVVDGTGIGTVTLVNNAIHGGRTSTAAAGDSAGVRHKAGLLAAAHNTVYAGSSTDAAFGFYLGARAVLVSNIIDGGESRTNSAFGVVVDASASADSINLIGNDFWSLHETNALAISGVSYLVNDCTWVACAASQGNRDALATAGDPQLLMDWDVWPGHREPTPGLVGRGASVDVTAWLTTGSGLLLRDIDDDQRPARGGGDTGADQVRGIFVANQAGCAGEGEGTAAVPLCSIQNALDSEYFDGQRRQALFVGPQAAASATINLGDFKLFGGYNSSWQRVLDDPTTLTNPDDLSVMVVASGAQAIVQGVAISCVTGGGCLLLGTGSRVLIADSSVSALDSTSGRSTAVIDYGELTLLRTRLDGGPAGNLNTTGLRVAAGGATVVNSVVLGGTGSVASIAVASEGALVAVNNYLAGNGTGAQSTAVLLEGGTARLVDNILVTSSGANVASIRDEVAAALRVLRNNFSFSACHGITWDTACIQNTALNAAAAWNNATPPDVADNLTYSMVCASEASDYRTLSSAACVNTGVEPAMWWDGFFADRDVDGVVRPLGGGWDIGINEQ